MAANRSQGSFFTLFLVTGTIFSAGLFDWSSGLGKFLFVIGAIGLIASLFGMLKIKSLEGRTALKPSPLGMKLIGAFIAAFGWLITLFGMHLTDSVGGRLVLALIGIGVSLFGIIVVLPAAFNKNAVWKT